MELPQKKSKLGGLAMMKKIKDSLTTPMCTAAATDGPQVMESTASYTASGEVVNYAVDLQQTVSPLEGADAAEQLADPSDLPCSPDRGERRYRDVNIRPSF